MRLRSRLLLLPMTVLCTAVVGLPSSVALESSPTIEAKNESATAHSWSPAQATVGTGGAVTFKNSTAVPHGVEWIGAGAKPDCTGVPQSGAVPSSGTNWSGTCTFTQAGTYSFYCTVHGAAMRGTITVSGPPVPTASTSAATAVGETAATLNGTVNPKGQATSYFFNYGTSVAYGQSTPEQSIGEDEADHPATATLSGLAPGTLYHFQLVASYASGAHTTVGADRTFTTASPPAAPTVSTSAASAIAETSATLNGTVDPQSKATSYSFQYGTTLAYGQSTPEQQAGADSSVHAVSASLNGLVPGTLYHFRLLAHNELGATPGTDQTFTTGSTPPPPSPPILTQPPETVPIATSAGTGGSGSPSPTSPPAPSPPAASPAKLTLGSMQHGGAVHGSITIPAGEGAARLEVDLLAPSASLAKAKRPALTLLGKLTRASVKPGKLSFAVTLNAKGKRALRKHRHLALTVQITLTPQHGAASNLTRKVVVNP